MLGLGNLWTRFVLTLMLTQLVSACEPAGSLVALCDGTRDSRSAAARAVANDGGPDSVVAVDYLIRQLDRGCSTTKTPKK